MRTVADALAVVDPDGVLVVRVFHGLFGILTDLSAVGVLFFSSPAHRFPMEQHATASAVFTMLTLFTQHANPEASLVVKLGGTVVGSQRSMPKTLVRPFPCFCIPVTQFPCLSCSSRNPLSQTTGNRGITLV